MSSTCTHVETRQWHSLWDTEEGRVDWRRVRISAAMGYLQRTKASQPWALGRAVPCEFVMHSYGLAGQLPFYQLS